MIDFLKKQPTFIKIEFWAFTTLFVFILFFFVTDGLDGASAMKNAPYRSLFEKANIPFSYYRNHFIPYIVHNLVLFSAFISLNFIIVPRLVRRQAVLKNLAFTLLILFAAWIILGIANTYIHGYRYANASRDEVVQAIFVDSFEYIALLFLIFLLYTAIKQTGLYLLAKSEGIHNRYSYITREAIVATYIWLVLLLMFWIGAAEIEVTFGWTVLVPYAILFYSYAFYKMLPRAMTKKYPLLTYLAWSILIIALSFFPVMLVGMLLLLSWNNSTDLSLNISALNMVFQLFVTVPLTWLLFKRQQQGNEEVTVLKKELKQSTANIDFLRSQINPHFLFNALNTLYGTAIQENAERTSEGIQKLGDMMRFMLQENMQDKISLSREIDYLENYISLQRLRTDSNPAVRIHTAIDNHETLYQIAPMLLIPFVENAFKHGISFREPSHIKIILQIKDRTLYFDVSNSKHVRQHNDPEKDQSGIGLENVKQRLKLLYPNRHELIIRDSATEFFIHLTVQLT